MKTIKSFCLVQAKTSKTGHRWVSALKFADGSMLFAGIKNNGGALDALNMHQNFFTKGLKVGMEMDENNLPTRENRQGEVVPIWQPLPEGWKLPR